MKSRSNLQVTVIALLLWFLPAMTNATQTLQHCKVRSVADGDTLRVSCDQKKYKVRLYCIDAPEIGQRPWGQEAREFLRSSLKGKVNLVVHGHDNYGRKLAEVFVKGKNINLEMVKSGKSAVYARYCPLQQYFQAAYYAQIDQLGIWSRWGLQQTPWLWRKQQP